MSKLSEKIKAFSKQSMGRPGDADHRLSIGLDQLQEWLNDARLLELMNEERASALAWARELLKEKS